MTMRILRRRGALVGDDPPGRLDAVDHRHADVHQHDVGPLAQHDLDRLGAVAGLADDVDVGRRAQQHAEPAAHQRLIVGDDHGDGH